MHLPRNLFFLKCCLLLLAPSISAQGINPDELNLSQCPISIIPRVDLGSYALNADADSFRIISEHAVLSHNNIAKFTGNVTLIKGEQKIVADELEFNRSSSLMNATGDIHFQNDNFDVFASDLNASNSQSITNLHNASYQINGNPGHGSASTLAIKSSGSVHLYDSSYTTCYGETPSWELVASEINILPAENTGEAYHARFKVMDVPILYIPYFTFPLKQERKTGFLYPSMGTSSNTGVEFSTPFYWNIAENYDATITPHYMSKRGMQLITEVRYLESEQNGVIDFEYLNKDHDLKDDNDPRYLARWQHSGGFGERYRAYVDYTTISDDNYIVDIGSKHYNDNDAYLYQIGELAYFSDTWQTLVKLQDFEVLGDHLPSYKTLPQIEFASHQNLPWMKSRIDVYSEYSNFSTNDPNLPEANRYHIEAGLTIPIVHPAYFFNSEFKILETYYQQTNIDTFNVLEKNVNRTLPKIRFHGGLNLDRQTTIFSQTFTQTLEPQLQYLYIPDKDQSSIGLYDTTTLQDDYAGLFRDRRFSGLDRIAQANQYSWGVTSRFLDASNIEQFSASIGRIVYINNSNIAIDERQGGTSDKSALAADLFFRLNNEWQVSGNIQYDTEEQQTNTGQTNIDYRYDEDHVIQLNHRFARNVSDTNIDQVSLLSTARISEDWQFIGRITQDLKQKRNLESYAGFQYESCCWAVRFAYHRHINTDLNEENFVDQDRDKFDSGFMIQFIIKGLDGNQSSINTQDMLNSSIFGYKEPYFLNN